MIIKKTTSWKLFLLFIVILAALSSAYVAAPINLVKNNPTIVLAYMNKTYDKDIHYSEELYKSFEKHYLGNSKYYICVPKKNLNFFHQRFSQMLSNKEIKNMPILVEEEKLLDNLSLKEFKNMTGHEQQQVIKLSFWKYNSNITHYITFDSDIILINPFDDNIFFQNNILKTLMYKDRESAFAPKINSVFAEANSYEKTHDKYFICAYGLWNVAILKNLEKYLQKTDIKSFTNMIKIAPVEMERYGKFLYLFYPLEFEPQSPILAGITGFVSSKDYSILNTEKEVCNQYCEILSKRKNIVASICNIILTIEGPVWKKTQKC